MNVAILLLLLALLKKILIATFKMASKAGIIFNCLALTEAVIFLLIEVVKKNYLSKLINRGRHYKMIASR